MPFNNFPVCFSIHVVIFILKSIWVVHQNEDLQLVMFFFCFWLKRADFCWRGVILSKLSRFPWCQKKIQKAWPWYTDSYTFQPIAEWFLNEWVHYHGSKSGPYHRFAVDAIGRWVFSLVLVQNLLDLLKLCFHVYIIFLWHTDTVCWQSYSCLTTRRVFRAFLCYIHTWYPCVCVCVCVCVIIKVASVYTCLKAGCDKHNF